MDLRRWIWIPLLFGTLWAQTDSCLTLAFKGFGKTPHSQHAVFLEKALDCASSPEDSISILQQVSLKLFRKGNMPLCLEATQALIQLLPTKHKGQGGAWRLRALAFEQRGQYVEAERPYLRAIAAFEQDTVRSGPLAACCKSLGNLYTRFGDFEQAVFFLQKALKHYQLAKARPGRQAMAWIDLGEAFAWQDDLLQAFDCYEEALDLAQEEGMVRAVAQLASGRVKYLLQRYSSAQQDLEEALSFFEEAEQYVYVAETLAVLAELAMEKEDWQEAHLRLAQSTEAQQQAYEKPYRREVAKLHILFGQFHLSQQAPQQALHSFQKALYSILPASVDTQDVYQLPDPNHFVKENAILEALEGKMHAWEMAYTQDNDPQFLVQGLKSYQASRHIEDLLRNSYDYASSKLLLAESSHHRAEKGIAFAYRLFEAEQDPQYAEQIFAFAEGSKGIVLSEELRHSQALQEKIPEAWQKKYDRNRWRLSELQRAWNIAFDPAPKDSLNQLLQSQQFRLSQIRDSMESLFPEYQKLSYVTRTFSLAEIGEHLREGQSLVEYFWGKDAVYAICLHSGGLGVEKLSLPPEANLDSLGMGLFGFWQTDKSWDKPLSWHDQVYQRQAHLWYNALWKPLTNMLTPEVLVIPDGPLGNVPFDALLMTQTDEDHASGYSEYPYVFKAYTLAYAYSASWLGQGADETRAKSWLGIAPLSWEEAPLSELPFPLDGWDALSNLLGKGEVLAGEQATKSIFLDRIKNRQEPFQVLHIHSHAKALSQDPAASWIALSDSQGKVNDYKLFLSEIYALPLRAELAVLGACETAAGDMYQGEGVMSLSRGFAFAGCQSILSTLWPVNDRSSTWLLNEFYHQLDKGLE